MQVGENRIVSMEVDQEERIAPALIVRDDGPYRHEKHWRGAAVALPVFCLRTQDSVGAGEFEDIKKLVDVCDVAGVRNLSTCCLPILFASERVSRGTHHDSYVLEVAECSMRRATHDSIAPCE